MNWEEIYASGNQLNDYPFDDVVSFVRRYGKTGQNILELGCGAGNNLIWAVKEGFKVTGIDKSESAIKYAKEKALREGLYKENYAFLDYDFTKPITAKYDLIIDRYATTYLMGNQEIKILNHNIESALTKDGYYFTQLASSANTLELDPKPNLYNETDIMKLFQGWDVVSIKHRIESDVLKEKHYAVWNIIAQKMQ